MNHLAPIPTRRLPDLPPADDGWDAALSRLHMAARVNPSTSTEIPALTREGAVEALHYAYRRAVLLGSRGRRAREACVCLAARWADLWNVENDAEAVVVIVQSAVPCGPLVWAYCERCEGYHTSECPRGGLVVHSTSRLHLLPGVAGSI
jgi:hypothetical protein